MEFSYTNSRFKNLPIIKPKHPGQTINSPDFKKHSKHEKSSQFPLIRLLVTVLSLVLIVITVKLLPITESETRKLAKIEENLMSKTKNFIDAHYNKPKYKRKLVILLGEDHAFQEDISEMFNMRDDTVYRK